MKVSVIVPLFNKGEFIEATLASMLPQVQENMELIVVDDASSDDGVQRVLAIDHPRIRVVRHEHNKGPAAAANTGMNEAQGEYLVRLDADDLAVPDRVAKQVAFMDAHPEVGASGGALQLFGTQDAVWRFPADDEACKAGLLFQVPLSQGASILRRSVLEEHGLRYDDHWPRIGEDWLFWTRMAPHTRFANLQDVLIQYRRGDQNISHGRDKAADYRVVLEQVLGLLEVPYTEEELDAHLIGLKVFRDKVASKDIKALRAWYDALLRWNAEHGRFDQDAFKERVARMWSSLFHFLP
ncbi:MAG: glycosyltransferase family 2 protein, partial [Flavobacteriales bacterium]|nr:glycosyltransferase family 2 protein [Flavobacteriales bacterium]